MAGQPTRRSGRGHDAPIARHGQARCHVGRRPDQQQAALTQSAVRDMGQVHDFDQGHFADVARRCHAAGPCGAAAPFITGTLATYDSAIDGGGYYGRLTDARMLTSVPEPGTPGLMLLGLLGLLGVWAARMENPRLRIGALIRGLLPRNWR